jgi:hypothetical protein
VDEGWTWIFCNLGLCLGACVMSKCAGGPIGWLVPYRHCLRQFFLVRQQLKFGPVVRPVCMWPTSHPVTHLMHSCSGHSLMVVECCLAMPCVGHDEGMH